MFGNFSGIIHLSPPICGCGCLPFESQNSLHDVQGRGDDTCYCSLIMVILWLMDTSACKEEEMTLVTVP